MLARFDYHRHNFTCHFSFSFRQFIACHYGPNENIVVTLCRAAGHFSAHRGVKKHQGCCFCKEQQGFKFLSQSSIHGSPCDSVEKLKKIYIYITYTYIYTCIHTYVQNTYYQICYLTYQSALIIFMPLSMSALPPFLYDSLWRPRFNSRPVHVGSVVDKVSP